MVDEEMSELPKSFGGGVVAGFVTAGHSVLFEDVESHRCDVCATSLRADDASDADSDADDREHHVTGRGLLVWSRGEERRYQEPPLCSGCAAAIGVSALQRWEIEEEEG
ncbi:MAG: hypothetical protein JWO86_4485 [Myxococcaceae bacterium]|jgi:hypothetical protein|nr:hypothetical protein [Myxococcaceae bacterium]MEA2746779.1 hypothetical protein [Myxococcales bacterium]